MKRHARMKKSKILQCTTIIHIHTEINSNFITELLFIFRINSDAFRLHASSFYFPLHFSCSTVIIQYVIFFPLLSWICHEKRLKNISQRVLLFLLLPHCLHSNSFECENRKREWFFFACVLRNLNLSDIFRKRYEQIFFPNNSIQHDMTKMWCEHRPQGWMTSFRA